jgi:hypothetical protein
MPRNPPSVKLATGSLNPYPIEELTPSPTWLFFYFYILLLLSCSVKN